jgi:hypothetical protein
MECFVEGDLVLVLQFLAGKPLAVKYIGPFKVLKKTSPVDYLIEFKGHRKVVRNILVNMLKRYVVRTKFVNVVNNDIVDYDDCLDCSYVIQPKVVTDENLLSKLKHLSISRQKVLRELLNKFSNVISDDPGCTDILEHKIQLKPNAKVVKCSHIRCRHKHKTN